MILPPRRVNRGESAKSNLPARDDLLRRAEPDSPNLQKLTEVGEIETK